DVEVGQRKASGSLPARQAAGHLNPVDVAWRGPDAAVAYRAFGDGRGFVARLENRGVDRTTVRRSSEGTRSVAEQLDDGLRVPADIGPEVGRIENENQRARCAGRCRLRRNRLGQILA